MTGKIEEIELFPNQKSLRVVMVRELLYNRKGERATNGPPRQDWTAGHARRWSVRKRKKSLLRRRNGRVLWPREGSRRLALVEDTKASFLGWKGNFSKFPGSSHKWQKRASLPGRKGNFSKVQGGPGVDVTRRKLPPGGKRKDSKATGSSHKWQKRASLPG